MADQPLNIDIDGEPIPPWEEVAKYHAAAAAEWVRQVDETIAEVARDMAAEGLSGPQLISVDQLRAAGALDCPPAWRKSLSAGSSKSSKDQQRDLFSDLRDDDEARPKKRKAKRIKPSGADNPGAEKSKDARRKARG